MFKTMMATVFIGACGIAGAQQTIVLPAVSDNVLGLNGSIWATELQVIKLNPEDQLTVRRLWVCVEGGGFAEDPEEALTWDMSRTGPEGRILQLLGADILAGTGASLGAVGLVVEGGEVITNARVADVSNGTLWGGTPFGQGQLIPTEGEALAGPAHIPWLGGCLNQPCNSDEPSPWFPYLWSPFRNNIGVVNPNSEPLTVSAVVLAFGYDAPITPVELEVSGDQSESFTTVVPPFGWTQFPWVSDKNYGGTLWGDPRFPYAGFVISLTPDANLPYYAYASVVFAPDPQSDIPAFNDPLFIPARPGFVAPIDWEKAGE